MKQFRNNFSGVDSGDTATDTAHCRKVEIKMCHVRPNIIHFSNVAIYRVKQSNRSRLCNEWRDFFSVNPDTEKNLSLSAMILAPDCD